jgi:hypothetical protein
MPHKPIKDKEKLLTRVLKEINQIRKALDLQLLDSIPLGLIKDPNHCPLANVLCGSFFILSNRIYSVDKHALKKIAEALNSKFVEKPWGHFYTTYYTITTDTLEEFVKLFDTGYFPELVQEER